MSNDNNYKIFKKAVEGDNVLETVRNAISRINLCSDASKDLEEALASLPEDLLGIIAKESPEGYATPKEASRIFLQECLFDPKVKSFER